MEGVVGLYELNGVSDFLALEDVVIEVQIRHRLLEHLVVLGSIAFENGTCRGGRRQRVRRARTRVSEAQPGRPRTPGSPRAVHSSHGPRRGSSGGTAIHVWAAAATAARPRPGYAEAQPSSRPLLLHRHLQPPEPEPRRSEGLAPPVSGKEQTI